MSIQCIDCKRALDEARWFDSLQAFWPNVNVVKFTCPECGKTDDVRVEDGAIWHGYVAAGGAPSFIAMVQEKVPRLDVHREDDVLVVSYGNRMWRVKPVSQP